MANREVTQPSFVPEKSTCYRCDLTRVCWGKPSLCESCHDAVKRGKKLGTDDRRSIRVLRGGQ